MTLSLVGLFVLITPTSNAQHGGSGNRIVTESQHPLRHQAKRIRTDTTNFDNQLSSSDTDLQTALETLDEVTSGTSSTAGDSAWELSSRDSLIPVEGSFTAVFWELSLRDSLIPRT